MHYRIAIHLTGRGLKNSRFGPFGQSQYIDGTMDAGLGRLDRIELIMNGRCRAGQIVDLIDFDVQGKGNVVPKQFKIRPAEQAFDILFLPGKIIVHAKDVIAGINQGPAQVGSKKTGTAGNQYTFS